MAFCGFWNATRRCDSLDVSRLRAGINAAEVVCSLPSYITLTIAFQDEAFAPLIVALEPVGSGRYRKVFTLEAEVRSAMIELMPPGPENALRSATLGPVGWSALADFALRAMTKHATSPSILLAKARQVMGGGTNLIFTGTAATSADEDQTYRNWQTAFEAEHEAHRLAVALREHKVADPIKVLAVVAQWCHGPAALDQVLNSLTTAPGVDVHILAPALDRDELALTKVDGAATWLDLPATDGQLPSPSAIAEAIGKLAIDLVLIVDTPGKYHQLAVPSLALEMALNKTALAVYADHDFLDRADSRHAPRFKPDWSPDLQAARKYIGQPIGFRATPAVLANLAKRSGGARDGWVSSSLLSELEGENTQPLPVGHVPRVLFHARGEALPTLGVRSASQAKAMKCGVASALTGKPLVSAIIPTKDNARMLAAACRSVREAEGVTAEIVIVDNGAVSAEQISQLDELAASPDTTVVRHHQSFNFSSLINAGRAVARGDFLLLLNDDVEAVDHHWLLNMVVHADRNGVGAVGPLLTYPNGLVQHAGIILGINGGVGHAFRFAQIEALQRECHLVVTREVSAVTGACLVVRKAAFDEVGGFDETLPVTLNDVDFCLKLRRLGYRNLVAPMARLIHRESTSRGLDVTSERLRRLSRETAIFRKRWGNWALTDPYYSPHKSVSHEDLRLRAL